MTPEELAELFRSDVEDEDANDPLWSDTEVYSYMDQAQKQFARETDYFSDVTTSEIVDVSVTTDEPFISLDPRITKIRGARMVGTGIKLVPKKYEDMENTGYARDAYDSYAFSQSINWESATGTPRFIVTDMEPNLGRLVPVPQTDDAIKLRVYRLPLEDISEANNSEFEITETEYQRGLMYYMKYLAYQKNDSDVYNEQLSKEAFALFQDFIDRVRRDLKRLRFGSTVGTVRYGGL